MDRHSRSDVRSIREVTAATLLKAALASPSRLVVDQSAGCESVAVRVAGCPHVDPRETSKDSDERAS